MSRRALAALSSVVRRDGELASLAHDNFAVIHTHPALKGQCGPCISGQLDSNRLIYGQRFLNFQFGEHDRGRAGLLCRATKLQGRRLTLRDLDRGRMKAARVGCNQDLAGGIRGRGCRGVLRMHHAARRVPGAGSRVGDTGHRYDGKQAPNEETETVLPEERLSVARWLIVGMIRARRGVGAMGHTGIGIRGAKRDRKI